MPIAGLGACCALPIVCKPISCDQADHLSCSRRASSSLRRSATSEATAGSVLSAIGVPSCFFIFLPSEFTGKSSGLSGLSSSGIASPFLCNSFPTVAAALPTLSTASRRSFFRNLERFRPVFHLFCVFDIDLATVRHRPFCQVRHRYPKMRRAPCSGIDGNSIYGNSAGLTPFHCELIYRMESSSSDRHCGVVRRRSLAEV
jgi:hypothetical protein